MSLAEQLVDMGFEKNQMYVLLLSCFYSNLFRFYIPVIVR